MDERDGRPRTRRRAGRRHGPGQDHPAHRPAPPPDRATGSTTRPDPRRVPGHARRQLAARAAVGSPRACTVHRYHGADRDLVDIGADRRGDHDLRHRPARPRRCWPSSRGAWWSPTRPSRSRTRTRRCRRPCASCRPGPASRSPARPSRTGSPSCGRCSTGPRPGCSAGSRRSGATSPSRSSATATRRHQPASPGSSRRSSCGAARTIPRSPPTSRPRPRPTTPSCSPRSRPRLYRAVVEEILDAIDKAEGIARRGLVLKLLTALKQVCNHPAHYLSQPGPLAGRSGKLDAFDDLVARHRRRRRLDARVHPVRRDGRPADDPPGRARAAAPSSCTARSRSAGAPRWSSGSRPASSAVFVISLKAGGVGLNLTQATHVVHYDRWWNPAVENQASDRAWRIGQDRPVQVHRLISEGTLEERIAAVLADKAALAEAVVGTGEAWLTELDRRRAGRAGHPGHGRTTDGHPTDVRPHLVGPGLDRGARGQRRPRHRPAVPGPHLRPQGLGRHDHGRSRLRVGAGARQPRQRLPHRRRREDAGSLGVGAGGRGRRHPRRPRGRAARRRARPGHRRRRRLGRRRSSCPARATCAATAAAPTGPSRASTPPRSCYLLANELDRDPVPPVPAARAAAATS